MGDPPTVDAGRAGNRLERSGVGQHHGGAQRRGGPAHPSGARPATGGNHPAGGMCHVSFSCHLDKSNFHHHLRTVVKHI